MASSDLISTTNMWPNYAVGNTATPGKTTGSSELGKDQFLKILVTQLSNQDPMQPMQDKEFIAQMAQFSSVEQLMNIGEKVDALSQSLGSASSLIGKEISWVDNVTQTGQSGVVDSILVSGGTHYAMVGKDKIALNAVTGIRNHTEAANGSTPEGTAS
ncbi:flagellar hook assembly protein FlgD [Paenibacillus spiritus]|uniref:Flagellar hook assembly protein FlgD n=1 Tax=Paenibacillus spiritus TaxID=2496557 RepID=A0A5J5GDZ5_9BACL|nr:flagellar hook capping FlgD N-terminal domain-containing protein [Paenibacillus spiritus]KAA9006395.1 flagellar hook assembly protein FlgD [Paenibacillus spiritus]